jgi:hypothetical protein
VGRWICWFVGWSVGLSLLPIQKTHATFCDVSTAYVLVYENVTVKLMVR